MRHCFWCIPVILAASAYVFAADLPFIEVDPAGTTALRERGTGRPFVPVGLNYFDPEVGWAPKLWQKFDEGRVRRHLDLIHEQGFNTIRVFLTLSSFHTEAGKVDAAGEAKFRKLLDLCRERRIYVIPVGPDTWEGAPAWWNSDRFVDKNIRAAEEAWWRQFAARFADDPVILAWDLANEPTVGWDSPPMKDAWNGWLATTLDATVKRWTPADREPDAAGKFTVPPDKPARGNLKLLDFQHFREFVGDTWTRQLSDAIRSADRKHMITVGHIQWVSPVLLPGVRHYAGFNLKTNTELLDFATVHFYPLEWPKPCDAPNGVAANRVYLQALLCDCRVRKPLMLGEFGWYGGGELPGQLPAKPLEHQVEWCGALLDISRGRVCGWLNWAFADTPTSTDVTRYSGCWTTDLKLKPWGAEFSRFARQQAGKPADARGCEPRFSSVTLDRDAALTDPAAGTEYRQRLLQIQASQPQ